MENPAEPAAGTNADQPKVDWFILLAGTAILLTLVIPAAIAPDWTSEKIGAAYAFITQTFGIYYVIAAIAITVFLLVIALGAKGKRLLGPAGTQPAYSTFAWASMLFCTGIGSSLIYWGAAEWAMYYEAPPYGVEPRSDEAISLGRHLPACFTGGRWPGRSIACPRSRFAAPITSRTSPFCASARPARASSANTPIAGRAASLTCFSSLDYSAQLRPASRSAPNWSLPRSRDSHRPHPCPTWLTTSA